MISIFCTKDKSVATKVNAHIRSRIMKKILANFVFFLYIKWYLIIYIAKIQWKFKKKVLTKIHTHTHSPYITTKRTIQTPPHTSRTLSNSPKNSPILQCYCIAIAQIHPVLSTHRNVKLTFRSWDR